MVELNTTWKEILREAEKNNPLLINDGHITRIGEAYGKVARAVCESVLDGYETTGSWIKYRECLVEFIATVMRCVVGLDQSRPMSLRLKDMTFSDVMMKIGAERMRQDGLWGEQNHHPAVWLSILGEEFGEVCSVRIFTADGGWSCAKFINYNKELIQTAAVATAMVECLDRGLF